MEAIVGLSYFVHTCKVPTRRRPRNGFQKSVRDRPCLSRVSFGGIISFEPSIWSEWVPRNQSWIGPALQESVLDGNASIESLQSPTKTHKIRIFRQHAPIHRWFGQLWMCLDLVFWGQFWEGEVGLLGRPLIKPHPDRGSPKLSMEVDDQRF